MNRPNALRQQLVLWSFVLGLWCLLILAFAGQLVFTGGLSWNQGFMLALRDWFPWALLTPVVAWLAFRFPLERGRLVASVPIHVVVCLLSLVFCELIVRPFPSPLGPPPGAPAYDLRGRPRDPLAEPPPFGRLPEGRGPDGRFPEGRRPGELGEGPPPEGLPQRGEFLPGQPPGVRRPAPPQMRRAMFANALINHAKFNLPIYWIIVTIVRASAVFRRAQERERQALELQSRLTEAKLQALRTQLHPHFLFNTLNAISTLVHKDPQVADEMIGDLSELLRATLDTTEQEIPLRQELIFLDRYLAIQQARFGDRLRVEKEIDAAVVETRVPTLILQPLVENAIRHGLEPQAGQGVLRLRAHRQGEVVHLTVQDNGVGLKPGAQADGIGLANTKARLEELYGAQGRLVVNTSSEGGCAVDLEIPYHEKPVAHTHRG